MSTESIFIYEIYKAMLAMNSKLDRMLAAQEKTLKGIKK